MVDKCIKILIVNVQFVTLNRLCHVLCVSNVEITHVE